MRTIVAALLVPVLSAAAYSQTKPPVPEKTANQPARTPHVAPPSPVIPVIQRVAPPVSGHWRNSLDAVVPPQPRGLIDLPAATNSRRFVVQVQGSRLRQTPAPCNTAAGCRECARQSASSSPRTTKTIPVKSADCTEVYLGLLSKLATDRVRLAGHTCRDGSRPIIVPEPRTNSLLVIGTESQIAELERLVKSAETKVDRFEIVINRIGSNGKKTVVAVPRLSVARGREARVEIARDGGTVLKLSVQVAPIAHAGRVTVFAQPQLRAVNDRCFDGRIVLIPPPAPGVPDMATVPVAGFRVPGNVRTASHIALPGVPPAPQPPLAVARPTMETRAYSVKNLIPAGSIDGAKALATVIRMTIEPASWSESGGEGLARVSASGDVLVIRQTAACHRRISNLLNQLRTAGGTR